MAQSYLFLLAFVLAVALASNIPPSADDTVLFHQLLLGGRVPGDSLVVQENVVRSALSLENQSLEHTFVTPGNQTITHVKVIDQSTGGTGGNVNVLYGGPGWWYIVLDFASKDGHDINSVVQIYANDRKPVTHNQ